MPKEKSELRLNHFQRIIKLEKIKPRTLKPSQGAFIQLVN